MLRRFFAYYRPYRGLFLLDFGCAVLSGLLELGFPHGGAAFVDTLLPGQDWGLILLASRRCSRSTCSTPALMAVVTYWGHVLGINIETEMRRKSFDHLQKLSFRFYDNQKTGHLVARVTKDLEEIGEVAHHGPEDLFIAVMTFLGAFALMFTVNCPLALITAAVVPLIAWVTSRYGGRMTQQLARAVRPGRRLQRAHRGERRRHAGRAGLRQRGPRARAVRRATTRATGAPSSRPTG